MIKPSLLRLLPFVLLVAGCGAASDETDADEGVDTSGEEVTTATGKVFGTGGLSLNVRKSPNTTSSILGAIPEGTTVAIKCQVSGQSVQGNSVWNYISAYGGYVADAFLWTGYDGFIPGVAKCSSGSTSSGGSSGSGGGSVTPPAIVINAGGMHFSEAEIRPAIESGVAYMLQRMANLAGVSNPQVSTITINYSLSNANYCGGYTYWSSADITCPWGYPVQGNNQNYVVNITMHEIGHMLAAQLLGAPDASGRDLCENEGIASWIAGKYWMNVYPATPVGSLREAALGDIASGKAWVSMSNCVSASDAWYTVYASFFEYLEKKVPGGVHDVATGKVSQWNHVDGWAAWMQ